MKIVVECWLGGCGTAVPSGEHSSRVDSAAGDVRRDFYMRSAPQPTATQSAVPKVGRRRYTS
ncbi:hypothetical protein GCM10009094_39280 [Massilia aurea]